MPSSPELTDAAMPATHTDQDGAIAMTPKTCAEARTAIETRRFVGPERTLGGVPTRWRILETPGYYRPIVSVRDGVVVLFDGMNPELVYAATTLQTYQKTLRPKLGKKAHR